MTFTVDLATRRNTESSCLAGLQTTLPTCSSDRRVQDLTVDQAIATAGGYRGRTPAPATPFTLMAIAALIATAGATNGTLFGSANLTSSLADQAVPAALGRTSRLGKNWGLLSGILASPREPRRSPRRLGQRCVPFLLVRSPLSARSIPVPRGDRSGWHRGDCSRARFFASTRPQRSRRSAPSSG